MARAQRVVLGAGVVGAAIAITLWLTRGVPLDAPVPLLIAAPPTPEVHVAAPLPSTAPSRRARAR